MRFLSFTVIATVVTLLFTIKTFSSDVDKNTNKNWGLKFTDVSKAWQITLGRADITVAIIDTGLDNIADAGQELWTNPDEIPSNGIDDDHNGFIDDVYGWDFTNNSPLPTDHHGHGSHIAGIIHAIAPDVKLMILKYYDPTRTPSKNLENTIKAIRYATDKNVQIINYSGGGTSFSRNEKDAIEKAAQKNILFIAAAGNEHSNNDKTGFYPATYALPNIISVTAIDQDHQILESSNFGKNSVHLAAPGKNIYSNIIHGSRGLMTGTSQATAFVSGAAALLLSTLYGKPSLLQLKKSLTETNARLSQLNNKTSSGSSLNIYRCLSIIDRGVSAFGVISPANSAFEEDTDDNTKNIYFSEDVLQNI